MLKLLKEASVRRGGAVMQINYEKIIEGFQKMADSGKTIPMNDFLNFLKKYSHIIIWGAGNLGEVIGKELLRRNIAVEQYWDLRNQDIRICNHVKVNQPFSRIQEKEKTLIICCITNAFVIPKLHMEMQEKKYQYIDGLLAYQILMCPVSMQHVDITECYKRKECNVATCKRMSNTIYQTYNNKDKVFINTLDLYVTQKCSLKCKYCYIYENSYPKEKKINYETNRILEDIDQVCEAASYIKRMVPFGGEPFLHPDIGIIIERMAGKSNIGVIDIISNGIFKQSDESLLYLKHGNVKINISNYNMELDQSLIKIRKKNIEQMKRLGLNVVVHNDTPQWREPGLIVNNGLDEKLLKERKKTCANFCLEGIGETDTTETMIVKNGVFFPCQHCDTIYNLDICTDQSDCIYLWDIKDSSQLAEQMKKLIHKERYAACQFCNPGIELVKNAGEQGIDERYSLKNKERGL